MQCIKRFAAAKYDISTRVRLKISAPAITRTILFCLPDFLSLLWKFNTYLVLFFIVGFVFDKNGGHWDESGYIKHLGHGRTGNFPCSGTNIL